MKLQYDAEANALYIRFSEDKIVESKETRPGMILDFDIEGRIVGIELLNARDQLAPKALADLQAAE